MKIIKYCYVYTYSRNILKMLTTLERSGFSLILSNFRENITCTYVLILNESTSVYTFNVMLFSCIIHFKYLFKSNRCVIGNSKMTYRTVVPLPPTLPKQKQKEINNRVHSMLPKFFSLEDGGRGLVSNGRPIFGNFTMRINGVVAFLKRAFNIVKVHSAHDYTDVHVLCMYRIR